MTELEKAAQQALEALESCSAGDYSTGHVIHPSFDVDAVNRAIEAIDALAHAPTEREQPAQHERVQPDSECKEDDGCPTEIAVLQRFWRGEPIPTEHYPAWVNTSEMERLASQLKKVGDRITLYTRPQPAERVKVWEAEGYEALMQEMQMVKDRNIRQHAEIERLSALVRAQQITIEKLEQQPAAQWVGLTDEEVQAVAFDGVQNNWNWLQFANALESKLREKNGGVK